MTIVLKIDTRKLAKALNTKLSEAQLLLLDHMQIECEARGVNDPRWLRYMIATNWHECRFKPVREGDWKGEGITDAQAYARVTAYCKKNGKKNYAARHPITKQSYYGRGGPQLTHYDNYLKLGEAIGLPLTTEPDLVLRPDVTAKVTVIGMVNGLFTGRKLSQYFDDKTNDPKGARRIVNGTDKAELIAGYYAALLPVVSAAPRGIAAAPKGTAAAVTGAAAGGAAVAAQAAGLNWGLVIAIGAGVVVAAVAIYFLNKRRRSL